MQSPHASAKALPTLVVDAQRCAEHLAHPSCSPLQNDTAARDVDFANLEAMRLGEFYQSVGRAAVRALALRGQPLARGHSREAREIGRASRFVLVRSLPFEINRDPRRSPGSTTPTSIAPSGGARSLPSS